MSKDYTTYATAKATDTMEAFADFLIAEVFGGTLPKGMTEAAFRKGVQLGGSLRMDFQKSESWKSDSRNYLANVEANRATKAIAAAAKAEESARKATERLTAAKAKAAALVAAAEAAVKSTEATDDAEEAEAA
jgi:hypothetical protein